MAINNEFYIKEGMLDYLDLLSLKERRRLQNLQGVNPLEMRAKREGNTRSILYWPLLMERIPLVAVRAANAVMAAQFGSFRPDGMYDVGGGWDPNATEGMPSNIIPRIWDLAGRKASEKFRLIVNITGKFYNIDPQLGRSFVRLVRKSHTTEEVGHLKKGLEWLKGEGISPYNIRTNVVAIFGRMPWQCCWAALSTEGIRAEDGFKLSPQGWGEKIGMKDLNWNAVKTAIKGLNASKPFVPPKIYWKHKWGSQEGIFLPAGEDFPCGPEDLALSILKRILRNIWGDENPPKGFMVPAINLVRLFGKDVAGIHRFFDAPIAKEGIAPGAMKNVAYRMYSRADLDLPDGKLPSGWGGFFTTHQSLTKWSGLIGWFSAPPKNKETFFDGINNAIDNGIVVEGELTTFYKCIGVGEDLRRYLSLMGGERTPLKTWEGIPSVVAGGSDYVLKKLGAHNPMSPAIGIPTACCQHLGGVAEACAIATVTRGDCAIWAIYNQGEVVAQALVWRSQDAIVLDSLEGRSSIPPTTVADLFLEGIRQAVGRLGIETAYLSNTSYGLTKYVRKIWINKEIIQDVKSKPPTPMLGGLGYTDVEKVYKITL